MCWETKCGSWSEGESGSLEELGSEGNGQRGRVWEHDPLAGLHQDTEWTLRPGQEVKRCLGRGLPLCSQGAFSPRSCPLLAFWGQGDIQWRPSLGWCSGGK